MEKEDKIFLSDKLLWTDIWKRHLQAYLKSPPRVGYWISSLFPKHWSVLEIAAGSARDSYYLSQRGYHVVATDNNGYLIEYLRSFIYPESSLNLQVEDAFALSFPDKSFDLSFHNGFWIYFDNNEQLYALIREQARVTRKILIAIVHNAENYTLVKTFQRKVTMDPLYNIRFFHREELLKLVKGSGIVFKSISIKKFGGPIDIFLRPKIKGMYNAFHLVTKHSLPKLYDLLPWSCVERIAVVIELE